MTFDAGRIRHDDSLMHYARASNGTAIPSNWIRSTDGTTAATWRPESTGSVSYGSNSNDVGTVDAAGASSLVSRADHVHRGVTSLAHSSNTYTGAVTLETEGSLYIVRSAANTYRLGTAPVTGGVGGIGNVTNAAAITIDQGAANLLTRPTITNAEDDAFDATSLDGKWLAYTGYDASTNLTALSGWCKVTSAGAKLQAIPAGDWTIECEVIVASLTGAQFTDEGLILTSGTTRASATEMRVGIGGNNGLTSMRFVWEKFVNGAFSSTYGNITIQPIGDHAFLKLVKSGTNYQAHWSSTGKTWFGIAASQAAGFTPSHFGFAGENGTFINYFVRY